MMSSQVAHKYGATVTYMAKPFMNRTGSGAHLHFHVADAKTGKNLFPLGKGEKDLKGVGYSKLAYHFIGGLLKHARAITAVASPTINCFRRIQSGEFVYSSASGYTWTPAFMCWGDNNRTQLTDRRGNTWAYTYDDRGNLLTATDPNAGVTAYTYDSQNNLLSATNAENHTTGFTYDPSACRSVTSASKVGTRSECRPISRS